MGNRVEELERAVASLEATVDGLTEELVETKERLRQLEGPTDAEADVEADPAVDDAESAHAEFVPNAGRTAEGTAAERTGGSTTGSAGEPVDGADDTDVYVVGDDETHGLTDHSRDDDAGTTAAADIADTADTADGDADAETVDEDAVDADQSDADTGMNGEHGGGDDSDGDDDIIVA